MIMASSIRPESRKNSTLSQGSSSSRATSFQSSTQFVSNDVKQSTPNQKQFPASNTPQTLLSIKSRMIADLTRAIQLV